MFQQIKYIFENTMMITMMTIWCVVTKFFEVWRCWICCQRSSQTISTRPRTSMQVNWTQCGNLQQLLLGSQFSVVHC